MNNHQNYPFIGFVENERKITWQSKTFHNATYWNSQTYTVGNHLCQAYYKFRHLLLLSHNDICTITCQNRHCNEDLRSRWSRR